MNNGQQSVATCGHSVMVLLLAHNLDSLQQVSHHATLQHCLYTHNHCSVKFSTVSMYYPHF